MEAEKKILVRVEKQITKTKSYHLYLWLSFYYNRIGEIKEAKRIFRRALEKEKGYSKGYTAVLLLNFSFLAKELDMEPIWNQQLKRTRQTLDYQQLDATGKIHLIDIYLENHRISAAKGLLDNLLLTERTSKILENH